MRHLIDNMEAKGLEHMLVFCLEIEHMSGKEAIELANKMWRFLLLWHSLHFRCFVVGVDYLDFALDLDFALLFDLEVAVVACERASFMFLMMASDE